MTRAPRTFPDGTDWVGKRVTYTPYGMPPEHGTVLRMSDSKHLAMFVKFDGDQGAKLCYAQDLCLLVGEKE